jgi:nucleoside-diphosphate-sugar epimerase
MTYHHSKLSRMTILITGASGFLGGRLTKYLAQNSDYKVIATSRSNHRTEELQAVGAKYIAGNPMQEDFILPLLESTDAVVHCAALSSPWGKKEDFHQANFVLTKQLMDWCKTADIKRFVNISTPSLYFNFQDRFDIKESEPLPSKLVNAYAETKLAAEQYVLAQNGKQIKVVSLRPRAIIGAEDTVLFPRLMRAYEEGKLRVIGDGKNIADFTSVGNLVTAIELGLHAPNNACGRSYNITDGQPLLMWKTVNTLLSRLGKETLTKRVPYPIVAAYARFSEWKSRMTDGKEPALVHYGVASLAKSVTLDISAAREYLGYVPVISTMETLEEFAVWYEGKASN